MKIMYLLNALSLAPAVNDWQANTRHPRILHAFDQVCNLINERREVLSLVTPQIGNGPFNVVIEGNVCFAEHFGLETPISTSADQLIIGNLTIHTAEAILWIPCPDWEMLHSRKVEITKQLTHLPITVPKFSNSLGSTLSSALANADIPTAKNLASQLAGLGQGLTPSGDDFIMGAIYAAWIIHPLEIASALSQGVAETAAPLTTSLSAAWLRSAGRGEAGELWHQFFDALVAGDEIRIKELVEKISAVGETSGADALAGFVSLAV